MSLRHKLMAVLAIPAIVLIAATALSYQTNRWRVEATRLLQRTYEIRSAIDLLVSDLVAAEAAVRGYLLTSDPGMLHPYVQARSSIPRHLDELGGLVTDPEAARLVRQLADHANLRLSKFADQLARSPAIQGDRAEVMALAKEGEVTMRYVLGLAETLREREDRALEERAASLARAERQAFFIRMVGLPAGLVLAGVIVALFAGRLVRRIEILSENTRRLEQGLPLVEGKRRRDELGALERAVLETGTRVQELQAELQRLATVDPLTGLANRRGFVQAAELRLDLARRDRRPLALVFVDADGLKHVNDSLGHAVGDELLQEIAALLRDTFRSSDLPARLGGDEFCVLVSAETEEGIAKAVERFTAAIERSNNLPGRAYRLAASIGVARFDPVSDRTIDQLIARADMLMYQEKRAKAMARATGSGPTPIANPTAPAVDGTVTASARPAP